MSNSITYPIGFSGNAFLSIESSSCIHSEVLPNQVVRLIECDINEKWMKVRMKHMNSTEWENCNIIKSIRKSIVDIDEKGNRWEGDCIDGKPCGYGSLYNENNNIYYSGFIFNEMKVCYGQEFYEDTGNRKYEGFYYCNHYFGYGILYNKMKEVISKGNWYVDQTNCPTTVSTHLLTNSTIQYNIQYLTIQSCCDYSYTVFRIIHYAHLKQITIEDHCFPLVDQFEIVNCNQLETINISDYCFTNHEDFSVEDGFLLNPSRCMRIKQCQSLKHIFIGKQSFNDYSGCCELTGILSILLF